MFNKPVIIGLLRDRVEPSTVPISLFNDMVVETLCEENTLSLIIQFFSVPHQPRLDWQMWFAALGSYQYNPWFISLIDKLLENKQDVLALLAKSPFPDKPPQFIRSTLYLYDYTRLPRNTSSFSDGLIRARFVYAVYSEHLFTI